MAAAAEGARQSNRLAGHAHEAPHPLLMPPAPDFELSRLEIDSSSFLDYIFRLGFIAYVGGGTLALSRDKFE